MGAAIYARSSRSYVVAQGVELMEWVEWRSMHSICSTREALR
jgi:hypothetical protein